MADILIETVRKSERAALDAKKQAQADAKELIDAARRDGERRLALAERNAARLLAEKAKDDAALAEALLQKEESAAREEAAALTETASLRMDKAVALSLERVGGVWQ